MKKTLLALAVPALLAASAANAATVYEKDGQKFDVYGRAQANIYDKFRHRSDAETPAGFSHFLFHPSESASFCNI